jgi:hypothetical protein
MKELYKGPEICRNCCYEFRYHRAMKKVAAQSRELLTSLAKVGITALVDEATGYQKVREKDALQKMFHSAAVRPAQVENRIRSRYGDKGKLRRDNPFYAETVDPVYGTFKVTPRREASKTIEENKA